MVHPWYNPPMTIKRLPAFDLSVGALGQKPASSFQIGDGS
jgi:hypothetical protein